MLTRKQLEEKLLELEQKIAENDISDIQVKDNIAELVDRVVVLENK